MKQLTLALLLCASTQLNAQNTNGNSGSNGSPAVTHWRTNGNNSTGSKFIGTKNEQPVRFKSNDVERLRISPDGNIGIGTTTPTATLDVNGSTRLNGEVKMPNLLQNNGLNGAELVIIKGDGTLANGGGFEALIPLLYEFKTCGPNLIDNPYWMNSPGKLFSHCPEVNVGIGTLEPTEKLHVVGNGLFTSSVNIGHRLSVGTSISNLSKVIIRNHNAAVGIEIDQTDNTITYNKLLFMQYTDPTTEIMKVYNPVTQLTAFQLEASGKMFIHNGTEKIFQLGSNGLLRTREIVVDAQSWADFVFEKNYDLMPLKEVEDYINLNGHLPNIPSSECVKEEGINIAEMNRLLLEKIEELTLHVIAQNKRIDELENNNH